MLCTESTQEAFSPIHAQKVNNALSNQNFDNILPREFETSDNFNNRDCNLNN